MNTKHPAPDDPMELHGFQCDGDPDSMLDCVAEEYARLGWPSQKILQLFESPRYPVLHRMLKNRGTDAIRRRIEQVVARSGVFRVRTSEAPEPAELVSLTSLSKGGRQDESGP